MTDSKWNEVVRYGRMKHTHRNNTSMSASSTFTFGLQLEFGVGGVGSTVHSIQQAWKACLLTAYLLESGKGRMTEEWPHVWQCGGRRACLRTVNNWHWNNENIKSMVMSCGFSKKLCSLQVSISLGTFASCRQLVCFVHPESHQSESA